MLGVAADLQHALAQLANAADRFDEVVDLPIPPLP
jgi:hypothetical protein